MKMNSKTKIRSPKIIRIIGFTVHWMESESPASDVWQRSKLLKTGKKNTWKYSRFKRN